MATINLELQPFPVPGDVMILTPMKDGDVPANRPRLKLEELSEETLTALCEEFTANVFAAAGKTL